MATGTVKWFDQKLGYGFILGPEGAELFVHYSYIVTDGFRTLHPGDIVEYTHMDGEKGPHALSVKCITEARELRKREKADPETKAALQS